MRYPTKAEVKISRKLILSELRQQGFKRTFTDRGVDCGGVCGYEKRIGERLLEVQLWGDGVHRVSHMLGGRGTTEPTDFSTVTGLKKAVEFETYRPERI